MDFLLQSDFLRPCVVFLINEIRLPRRLYRNAEEKPGLGDKRFDPALFRQLNGAVQRTGERSASP